MEMLPTWGLLIDCGAEAHYSEPGERLTHSQMPVF